MVAPNREIANKIFPFNISAITAAICPTTSNMSPNNNMNMIVDLADDLFEKNCDSHDEVKGCSLAHSTHCPRTLSLSSSECDEDYATRVQRESDKMVKDDPVALSDSLLLEYAASES